MENKVWHVIKNILEIIVAPFNVFIKSNGLGLESNKWGKAVVIFLVALVTIVVLLLFYYRVYIFGGNN